MREEFKLKPISREAIPRAIQKAERYRLINQSWAAESICRDILEIDPANQQVLVGQLTKQREQVSSVSLDEETTNMIKYQHAYQAAARMISVFDSMLDTLINHTGH